MPGDDLAPKMWDYFFFRKVTDKVLKEEQKKGGEEADKTVVRCSECGKAFPRSRIIRCYDCGRAYCIDCAGPGWVGVCADCEEVFEAEEDYWDWR